MPRKTDTPQKQIMNALRDMGAFVCSLHEVGRGVPDLLVSYLGQWHLVEVKSKNGQLNEAQEKFHEACGAPISIMRSVDDAVMVVGVWRLRSRAERREALDKLTEQAQKLKMGY